MNFCLILILYDYSWRPFQILCNDAGERLNISEGLFRTPSDRISQRIYIFRTSCSQLPTRSGIFCHLVEVVYWPCGLTFVYPTLNLAFLGIIVKVKLLVKFCLQDFVSKSVTKYFSSLFLGIVIGSRINSWCSILFSNLKQKRTQHYY